MRVVFSGLKSRASCRSWLPSSVIRGGLRPLSQIGSNKDDEVRAWLSDVGIKTNVANEIILTLRKSGGAISTNFLKQFSEKGLAQLVQSVERELEDRETKQRGAQGRVKVHVSNPRVSNDTKIIDVLVNDTLYDPSKSGSAPLTDDLEFACGGNAACSTCHVVVDPEHYRLLDPPEEEELDMLDLAWQPQPTSRLACQMRVPKGCDNMIVTIPHQANNLF